jgi:hypothetical protein
MFAANHDQSLTPSLCLAYIIPLDLGLDGAAIHKRWEM